MDKIIAKLLSGRYFCTMAVITTYCIVLLFSVKMVLVDKMTVETFLGMFVGFTTISTMIIEGYFRRSDRKEKEN